MAFTVNDLLLTPDRAGQLTKALSNLGIADPLQYLCDEAAADVARLITGYAVDEAAVRGFVRSLALYRAYGYAGPVPRDVEGAYKEAMKELEAIASGKRPNLTRADEDEENPPSGGWGSETKVEGRTSSSE